MVTGQKRRNRLDTVCVHTPPSMQTTYLPYISACVHTCMHVEGEGWHIHKNAYMCTHTCIHTSMYACMNMWVHACTCVLWACYICTQDVQEWACMCTCGCVLADSAAGSLPGWERLQYPAQSTLGLGHDPLCCVSGTPTLTVHSWASEDQHPPSSGAKPCLPLGSVPDSQRLAG